MILEIYSLFHLSSEEVHVMQKKPLTELLHDLEQEMLRLGYTDASIQFYRREWRKLLQFAQKHGKTFYSEYLGMNFIEKYYHIPYEDSSRSLLRSEVQKLRIIRTIGDFQLHHTILRRYYKHKELLVAPYFITIRDRFKSYCEDKDYSKVTIDHYVKQST